MAAKLSQLDPKTAWQPADVKWNLKWTAHLHRRAAFGFPALGDHPDSFTALRESAKTGMAACVDRLLDGWPDQTDYNSLLDNLGHQIAKSVPGPFGNNVSRLQGWWLYRMASTPHPLLERCTLFWHDHFATSLAKVRSPLLMLKQNSLLRHHALGKFQPLLLNISKDPAMLLWLDSNSNIKGKPNENYAREIMELFSLGVGNYTEKDIQEAARAFTGWHTASGKYVFNEDQHDNGVKTLLGQKGNWNGQDVVRILLEQKAAAHFLARKLFAEFVSQHEEPPAALLQPLADRLRSTGYDIRDCLSVILKSKIFYSEHAYRNRIKSPVEFVVGIVRALDYQVNVQGLANSMNGLGQALFQPPNVKGWDGGRQCLNSATVLARHNFAASVLKGQVGGQAELSLDTIATRQGGKRIDQQIRFLLNLLLQDDVSQETRSELFSYGTKKTTSMNLTQIAHRMMLLPEFQLS